MRFSRKIFLVGGLFILPLVALWVIIGSTTDQVALPFLFNKSFSVESMAEPLIVKPGMSNPQFNESQSSEPQESVSRKGYTQVEVQAKEENRLDRSQPNWLRDYCFELVQDVAIIPTQYERSRGPTFNFPPVYQPARYLEATQASTCNFDYYIHPVNKQAFADIGIEYQYSQVVWQEFQEAVAASISAQLSTQDWRVVTGDQSEEEPALMLTRTNRLENLREYLDVFFTNDEEIVFELLVVEP